MDPSFFLDVGIILSRIDTTEAALRGGGDDGR
jgi:hypothetical protein